MTDFKHIEEQIAWLDSVIAVFTLDCEPRQNLVKARDTMQAMLDVVRAAHQLNYLNQRRTVEPFDFRHLNAALDKLKAEKVIDAAENGRGCNQPPQKVSDSRNRSEK